MFSSTILAKLPTLDQEMRLFQRTVSLFALLLILLASQPSWAFDTRHVLGDSAEGLMQDYFKAGGWQSKQGQVGRQGIDGLFVKVENGVVRDVMMVESKYGKSRLGGNLICGGQQMSQSWLNCKLDDLIKQAQRRGNSPEQIRQYEQIKRHVGNNNYRGRLWNANVVNGKLSVDVQDVKSKGESVDLRRLSGGERYRIQSQGNTLIDLKTPQNSFQQRIADSYFTNLDNSLKTQGVPDADRARMMRDFRNDPSRITTGLRQYSLRTPPGSLPSTGRQQLANPSTSTVKSTPATKRASKGFIKSLGRNLKTGAAGATSLSLGGPVAIAAGFVGGVAVSMAADYLMDATVDTAYAAVAPDEQAVETEKTAGASSLSPDEVRRVVQKTARETQERISQVENRMVQEFAILGQDIQYRHEAQMAAIGLNLAEIVKNQEIALRVEGKVDALHADLHGLGMDILGGVQAMGLQLESMVQTLDSISARVDQILERLDASLKSAFDSGLEFLNLYDQTGERRHLGRSLGYFTEFINTFERIGTKTMEEDELLLLARYYRGAVHADYFTETGNTGYAQSAVAEFVTLSERSVNLDFLIMAYLTILDADTEDQAAGIIQSRAEESIRHQLEVGEMDMALAQALYLESLLGTDQARQFRKAVAEFVTSGRDQVGLLGLEDDDFRLLMAVLAEGGPMAPAEADTDAVRNILADRPSPMDFFQILNRYRHTELLKFAVRRLIHDGYYNDALYVLSEHPVQDDTFRIRAYLLLLNKLDISRYRQLRDLVLTDPTYSREAKDFVLKIDAQT
ncbi:hypothetical protein [Desulfonatronum parangueonense]